MPKPAPPAISAPPCLAHRGAAFYPPHDTQEKMNIGKLKTDYSAENDGKWFPMDDAEFLIASTGGHKYKKAIAERGRQQGPLRRMIGEEQAEAIVLDVLADTILLNWRGNVTDGPDNAPFPCTKENKLKLLSMRPFRDWLISISDDYAQFLDAAAAADAAKLGE